MHPLYETINALSPLQTADFDLLMERMRAQTVPVGENILRAGQYCKGVYFVQEGLTGTYRLVDGREMFQNFATGGDFVTDIVALAGQSPTEVTITALEGTELLYISRDDLLAMYAISVAFQQFGRRLLETLLARQTERTVRLATLTARQRYNRLVNEEPELLQRISLQHLASYLGMTRETLSRIRHQK